MKAKESSMTDLLDFFPQTESLPEAAEDLKRKPRKTEALRRLLEKARAYQEHRQDIRITGKETIEEEALSRFPNLRPQSGNEVVCLLMDRHNHLVDARHIRAKDLPEKGASAAIIQKLLDRRAHAYYLVAPEGLYSVNPSFAQAVDDANSAALRSGFGLDFQGICWTTPSDGLDLSEGQELFHPAPSFTYAEEKAIRDYWFQSAKGRKLTPSRKTGTFFCASRETEDTLARLQQGIQILSREEFCCATMNAKHEITGIHVLSIGSLDSSIVSSQALMEVMAPDDVKDVLLFHNHPSGDPQPSHNDVFVAGQAKSLARLLGKHAFSMSMGRRGCADFSDVTRADQASLFQPKFRKTAKEKVQVR